MKVPHQGPSPRYNRIRGRVRIFLVDVRDPRYSSARPGAARRNGRVRILGFPPLGIMTLSAVLKRAGHEVVLFDLANPATPAEAVVRETRRQRPALVGMSFLSTTSYPYARALARALRAADPGVRLAFGGVFASENDALILKQVPEIDFIGRGEGESLILDLAERRDDPSTVEGLTWRDGGTVRRNPDRPLERDLDRWPYPDREGLDLDYLESMPLDVPAVLSTERFTTVQTSRGCPFGCAFCDIPGFSRRTWRARSPGHVLGELRELRRQGYESVYFIDDHFLIQPGRVEAICKGILAGGIPIRWGCEGHVDSACRDLFPLMARAGCRTLMFGVESGCQKTLDRLRKGQSLEEIADAVRAAKRAGIEIVHGFFVVGCPGETEADMKESFRLAARLPLDSFAFNRLCVYRGTPLWAQYVRRGLLDDARDWYKFIKCSAVDPTVLPGEEVHRIRSRELRKLILHRFARFPAQTFRLLRRFARHMSPGDVIRLLTKPFLGKKKGATEAEVLSQSVVPEGPA